MNSSGVASSSSFSAMSLSAATAVTISAVVERGIVPSCSRARRVPERRLQPVVRGAQHPLDLGDEAVRLVRGQHALLDQLLLVRARARSDER